MKNVNVTIVFYKRYLYALLSVHFDENPKNDGISTHLNIVQNRFFVGNGLSLRADINLKILSVSSAFQTFHLYLSLSL